MQSGAMTTSLPSSSERRGATGPSENLSSGPDLGRPRCDESSTFAPFSTRYLTVGTDARMRVSSVMVLPSSGTLRSQRTSTLLPFRSASDRSPTDFLAISMLHEREIERIGAAPMVSASAPPKRARASVAVLATIVSAVGTGVW